MYPIEKYQFKVFEKTNTDGSKSSVVMALSTYSGKVVKGVAKCIASDPFDLEKGTQLAGARCDEKVCRKRKSRALKKYKEAKRLFDEAQKHLCAMADYYYESDNEHKESLSRLYNIEMELR